MQRFATAQGMTTWILFFAIWGLRNAPLLANVAGQLLALAFFLSYVTFKCGCLELWFTHFPKIATSPVWLILLGLFPPHKTCKQWWPGKPFKLRKKSLRCISVYDFFQSGTVYWSPSRWQYTPALCSDSLVSFDFLWEPLGLRESQFPQHSIFFWLKKKGLHQIYYLVIMRRLSNINGFQRCHQIEI